MAKKSKQQHSAVSPITASNPKIGNIKPSKVSDELRQAVKDLGGDEEDLELIAGVDSDDETEDAPKKSGKASDEKSLKKALGDFMKGLDFASVVPKGTTAAVGDDEGEDEDEDVEVSSGDDDDDEEVDGENDEDEDEDDDDDDGEDEEEDEDKDEEEEAPQVPPIKVLAAKAKQVEIVVPPTKSTKQPELKATKQAPIPVLDAQSPSGTIVPGAPIWPSLLPDLSPPPAPLEPVPPFKLNGLRSRAQNLLETLPSLSRASSSSDAAFIAQILQSGTHQDKLSALILIIRESPIHGVKELSRLRNMAGWKEDGTGGGANKDQRVAVMKALADWWVTGGGKEKGKLRYFADQPLLAHPDVTERHLLVFAFEDYLKRWFFNMLQVLEVLSHDTLPFVRTQALHIIFQLLGGNAEQEQNLLRLGVNKLGDSDRSVASKASHHILQLLQQHPAMKAVVAREVSALVLKPSSSVTPASSSTHVRFDSEKDKTAATPAKSDGAVSHARYYGLITLNQIMLTGKDQETAGRLVELYFEVFREVLGESMKVKEEGGEEGAEELDAEQVTKAAGKVERWQGRRKGAKPKGGRKAAAENEELVETGDAKLVAAVLTGINRALPFAKLDEEMFTKYMDTLFKITHAGTFNTSIQALTLIFQVCQSRQTVSDRFYRTLYDSLFDGRLITSSKQAMYLNLLIKSLKADTSINRIMAFVKRLLQMLGMHQPPFICGALYMLGELFATTPGLKRMLIEPEDEGDENLDAGLQSQQAESSKAAHSKAYDGRKREPQYANADASCLWDLIPLTTHFHPSVSLQAQQLLMSQPITGSPDISLNTLVSFLDRFVYRNPKKTVQPKGASIMQPAAANDRSGMVVNNRGARSGDDGFVNSEKFWRKKIEDVPVDQMFFHKFFSSKLAQKSASKKKKAGKAVESGEEDEEPSLAPESEVEDDEEDEEAAGGADDDEGEEDPEEDEVWAAMQANMPAVGDDMGLSDDDDVDDDDDGDDEDGELDEEDESEGDEGEDEEEEDEDDNRNHIPARQPKPAVKAKSKTKQPSPESESDDFPNFDDEDEDLLSLDEMPEMPDIPLDAESPSADEAKADGIQDKKRKRKDEKKERKKKRREMPTFGNYEDYQKLIEEAESEGEQ